MTSSHEQPEHDPLDSASSEPQPSPAAASDDTSPEQGRDETADETVAADQPLCPQCGQYPLPRPSSKGGRPPQFCQHVWGRTQRGRDIKCRDLNEAEETLAAIYGAHQPLRSLDRQRWDERLQAAMREWTAATSPVTDLLQQVQATLAEDVSTAHNEAEVARSEADDATAMAHRAEAERDEAHRERTDAVAAAEAAEADAALARQDRDTAREEARVAREAQEQSETSAAVAQHDAQSARAEQAAAVEAAQSARSDLDVTTERLRRAQDDIAELRTQLDAARGEVQRVRDETARTLDQERADARQQRVADQQDYAERAAQLNERITNLTSSLAAAHDRHRDDRAMQEIAAVSSAQLGVPVWVRFDTDADRWQVSWTVDEHGSPARHDVREALVATERVRIDTVDLHAEIP